MVLDLPSDLRPFYSGRELYGENLTDDQVNQWLADESTAYGNLGFDDSLHGEAYPYHEANRFDFWNDLFPRMTGCRTLGFGSAHGAEFIPLLKYVGTLTIVEVDGRFHKSNSLGDHATYRFPNEKDGLIPEQDNSFDLVTCLGVLHHIPRVSVAIKDLSRVLAPGGILVLREPTNSMGDWRIARPGLTAHERGIPLKLLESMLKSTGFHIQSMKPVDVGVVKELARHIIHKLPSQHPSLTRLDRRLGQLPIWDTTYRRSSLFAKLGPTSASIIAIKL